MADQSTQNRLAAVLAADVAGYTQLVEQDTDGTVAAWQAARADIINPTIDGHAGRVVKLTGDGFLAEFATVQDAVRCAIAMQGGLVASSLDFRMGVNLGDIVDNGEDIHGEGVNVAARIEALADPGGITISGGVHNQLRNRIDADYEDLGERRSRTSWPRSESMRSGWTQRLPLRARRWRRSERCRSRPAGRSARRRLWSQS